MNKTVFFIDDDEIQRRGCVDALQDLFKDTTIQIEPLVPFATLAEYSALIASNAAAAFILDERLTTTGIVTYNGLALAAHLRSIGGDLLPIVILTNFPPDDFPPQGWAVENIFEKKILTDLSSPGAQALKLRLLRQIEITGVLLAEREQRFHDLLIKSLKEKLTADEEHELSALEGVRLVSTQAQEFHDAKSLENAIEKLKAKLEPDKLNL